MRCIYKKMQYLTFDLGVKVTQNVAQYPLYHVTFSATKFKVAMSRYIYKKIHYLTFDLGVKVTQNVAQCPLHHVTYSATKFEVATSNGLGGETFTRNGLTDGLLWHKINIPFFSKEKSGYNLQNKTMKSAGSRPNTKISVLWVTGLKILGRVGIHIFNCFFFLETKYNLMYFERHFILYFFPKKK